MIAYPATSLYPVTPVARFFRVRSLARGDVRGVLLFDMDTAIRRLDVPDQEPASSRELAG
ncbi:hypothetical protein ACVBGC_18925 [Burkholderia stagnalis]